MFTAVSQLKNIQVGLSGSQEMHISSVEKWVQPVLMQTKNKEHPRGFAGRIFKEQYDRKTIKQLRRYFCV